MNDIEARLKDFYSGDMADRAERALDDERLRRVQAFTDRLRATGAGSVLEVGCGAGRDGLVLAGSGVAYTGVDLTPEAVRICRDRGLVAVEASAVDLPFADDTFDAAWSMSTLMHLPGDGLARALGELRRVVRAGGTAEIGVWGHSDPAERTRDDGRYFLHRSDEQLRAELEALGEVVAFATWGWKDDGKHYQWARAVVG
ncbi:SAM-dependent methyltransferase [Actinotalea ferrariae CF5-4]|uniref:SAM-dependent methyltransferase n=1 Tax=Actinotalea ferrariae CF5-4 TaxID=948458 RepID=A0A021VS63_9CELL|nr:class I SAM-dependent methyltransferase [Actinotalea ferrariae]EYR64049.1 SAM-dependent methyltransferase [Actinotalea ferrariae CF5-4]